MNVSKNEKETHPHKPTVYAGVWCLYSFFDGFTTNKYGSYIIGGILDPFFKLYNFIY